MTYRPQVHLKAKVKSLKKRGRIEVLTVESGAPKQVRSWPFYLTQGNGGLSVGDEVMVSIRKVRPGGSAIVGSDGDLEFS